MKVRGHYNGAVVVLDEPAPVRHPVEVRVEFPSEAGDSLPGSVRPVVVEERIRIWEESRARLAHLTIQVSDEICRQRDLD